MNSQEYPSLFVDDPDKVEVAKTTEATCWRQRIRIGMEAGGYSYIFLSDAARDDLIEKLERSKRMVECPRCHRTDAVRDDDGTVFCSFCDHVAADVAEEGA